MSLTNENMDTADQVRYLGPEAVFSLTPGGFVNLSYEGKVYEKVNLRRLLPFTDRGHYISVLTEEEEIGILRDLDCLPKAQRELIWEVLGYKYFTPGDSLHFPGQKPYELSFYQSPHHRGGKDHLRGGLYHQHPADHRR